MKKLFRILLGLIAGASFAALFVWLSWYVVDEGSAVGYVASGLFVVMAVFGAILGFIWFAGEDKTDMSISSPHRKNRKGSNRKASPEKADPVLMGAAMMTATSDNFTDIPDTSDTDVGGDDSGDFFD